MKKTLTTAFIWNRNIFVILNIFTVSFDQFNASLVSKSIYLKNVTETHTWNFYLLFFLNNMEHYYYF